MGHTVAEMLKLSWLGLGKGDAEPWTSLRDSILDSCCFGSL